MRKRYTSIVGFGGLGDVSSIRDVAARAGVSITTVSKIINQKESAVSISPETRERVLAAVRELNFVPSPTARALRKGGGGSAALVVAVCVNLPGAVAAAHPLLQPFLIAAEESAAAAGATLAVCVGSEPDTLQRLASGPASAVIAFGPFGVDLEGAVAGRPLVGVECLQVAPGLSSVEIDNREGMRIAVQHLAAMGHRRVAVLSAAAAPGSETGPVLEREAAFRSALPRYGLAFDPGLLVRVSPPDNLEAARWTARGLLQTGNGPTAVIALSERLALAVCRAAAELGRHVPADISVVAWSGGDGPEWYVPPLTAVHIDAAALGHLAMQEALARTRDPGQPPRQHLVPVQLIGRASTGQASR